MERGTQHLGGGGTNTTRGRSSVFVCQCVSVWVCVCVCVCSRAPVCTVVEKKEEEGTKGDQHGAFNEQAPDSHHHRA